MAERDRDTDEEGIFESVYDEEKKRWTLRRLRVAPVASGAASAPPPVHSGVQPAARDAETSAPPPVELDPHSTPTPPQGVSAIQASERSVQARREQPTIAAPSGSVTRADGAPLTDPPPAPRLTPIIDAPSGLAIPLRTTKPLEGHPLDVRIAFLLCHIDGRSTITEIACFVERPVQEVASAFGLLAAMGIVELIGNIAHPRPATVSKNESGVRPAVKDPAHPTLAPKQDGRTRRK